MILIITIIYILKFEAVPIKNGVLGFLVESGKLRYNLSDPRSKFGENSFFYLHDL